VAYTCGWGDTRVTPSFSAQWQHEFLDDQLPFDARFSNDLGNPFTVYGPKVGRDSALLTAGLNVAWKNYAAYVAYQADLGRKNYESHSALIGMRVSW
jgi:outer membrane autotransporter protein